MAIICPTVTAQTPDMHEYRRQMERIENLAPRFQLDLMDGDFAPTKSPPVDQLWVPEGLQADVHIMYRHPADALNALLDLKPRMVIVHVEANVDVPTIANALKAEDILFGLAMLPPSWPEQYMEELQYADHVLVFAGDLGHFGGQPDMSLLRKVSQLKRYKPDLEIGWDGGVRPENALELASGGVDVLNVGGFIQKADDPAAAYAQLVDLIKSANG